MARGDECKTATKATFACKQFDVSAPMKKQMAQASNYKAPQKQEKQEQKKDYGAWGNTFKDKKTFTEMHLC